MGNLLEVKDLWFLYGSIAVTKNVSMGFETGERHAVIGPNGAGKTTFFDLLTGRRVPKSGNIYLNGEEVTRRKPYELVARGLTRSFQITSLFKALTVRENLRLAVQALRPHQYNMLTRAEAYKDVEQKVEAAAAMMALEDYLDKQIGELAYGQCRQLEVCMALSADPKIVLLDEPAAGTSPAERIKLVDLISGLPRDITVLLVEHDMDIVFSLSDRISVLCYGELIATGTPQEVRANDAVQSAYLGKSHAKN